MSTPVNTTTSSFIVTDTPVKIAVANVNRKFLRVENKLGADGIRVLTSGETFPANVSEVQDVDFSIVPPTAGVWRLTFDGQETADLSNTLDAAALQTALELLSNVGAGDIVEQVILLLDLHSHLQPRRQIAHNLC